MFEFICYLVAVGLLVVGAVTRDLRWTSGGLAFAFLPPLINAAKALQ